MECPQSEVLPLLSIHQTKFGEVCSVSEICETRKRQTDKYIHAHHNTSYPTTKVTHSRMTNSLKPAISMGGFKEGHWAHILVQTFTKRSGLFRLNE